MLSCGIDVGSVQTKVVIVDGNSIVQGRGIVHSGANLARASRHAFKAALLEADCEEWDITFIMGTGYGRFAIPFSNTRASETVCHARGAIYHYPETRTVIDIGGQDTTAIKVDESGNVLDFAMNDKCSAGSGRFLESTADLLGLSMKEVSRLEFQPGETLLITNHCSVMAEVEITNWLEQGKPVEQIISGVFGSIAQRASSLAERIGIEPEITITGGVSQLKGIESALEETIQMPVNRGVDNVFVGALGAALLGLEQINRSLKAQSL